MDQSLVTSPISVLVVDDDSGPEIAVLVTNIHSPVMDGLSTRWVDAGGQAHGVFTIDFFLADLSRKLASLVGDGGDAVLLHADECLNAAVLARASEPRASLRTCSFGAAFLERVAIAVELATLLGHRR